MKCERCYFDNPAQSHVCEYCGAQLGDKPQAEPSGSAAKRQTMLGRSPSDAVWAKAERPDLDPEDPFRAAARVVGGAASIAAPPSAAAPSPAVSSPAPPRSQRATIVDGGRPAIGQAEVAGVLVVFPPSGPPCTHLLRVGRTRVGRAPNNDLVLDDERASSDHLVLRIDHGAAWLLDTSSNGTIVGGVRYLTDKVDLGDDAVITAGRTRMVLKLLSAEALEQLRGDV